MVEEHKWVYEAVDEDDYGFNEDDMTWEAAELEVEGEGEYYEEEYYEEEYYEEEVVEQVKVVVKPLPKLSNVEVDVFYDDNSVVNCWEAALTDYKYAHPDAFGPISEAPRSMVKKLQMAPMWYAPAPSVQFDENYDNKKHKNSNGKKRKRDQQSRNDSTSSTSTVSPSITSTASVPPSTTSTTTAPTSTSIVASASTVTTSTPILIPIPISTSSSPPPTSSKKQKLNSTTNPSQSDSKDKNLTSPSWTPVSPNLDQYSSTQNQNESFEELDLISNNTDSNSITSYQLQSPKINHQPKSKKSVTFAGPQLPPSYLLPTQNYPSSSSTSSTPNFNLPTPSEFIPPPTPSSSTSNSNFLSRDYPQPPEMIEPPPDSDLISTTAEEKLQNALWSWYEAGYQTALYHTALGQLRKEREGK